MSLDNKSSRFIFSVSIVQSVNEFGVYAKIGV